MSSYAPSILLKSVPLPRPILARADYQKLSKWTSFGWPGWSSFGIENWFGQTSFTWTNFSVTGQAGQSLPSIQPALSEEDSMQAWLLWDRPTFSFPWTNPACYTWTKPQTSVSISLDSAALQSLGLNMQLQWSICIVQNQWAVVYLYLFELQSGLQVGSDKD